MKNKFKKATAAIISMLMLLTLSACSDNRGGTVNSDTEQTGAVTEAEKTDTITETAAEVAKNDDAAQSLPQEPAIGGDENVDFYQPGNTVLDNIPVSLMKLRPDEEVTKWISSYQNIFEYAPDSIEDYANIYSFITSFGITKEEAQEALQYQLQSEDPQIKITQEEFDTLFCGDVEKITKAFASEYSIVVGKNIYSPHWVYTHSTDDYKEAGITSQMIEEKIDKYSLLVFTDTEKNEFDEKLSKYTEKNIAL